MVVKGGGPGDEDVVVGIAHDAVGSGAADQEVAAVPSDQEVSAALAQQDVVAGAALEAVVAISAVQPGGQTDASGDLDVVVATQAVGDQPASRSEGGGRQAVDRHRHRHRPAGAEGDRVVAGRAADGQFCPAGGDGVRPLTQGRAVLEGDGYQLGPDRVGGVRARLDVHRVADGDRGHAPLDAAAGRGDIDVAGDVGDRPAAAGVQGVEDPVLDPIQGGDDHPVLHERVANGRHGVRPRVSDQLAGAADAERVAAGVGGGTQVDRAAGDLDGGAATAG